MMIMRASEKLLFSLLLLFLAHCCGSDGECVWERVKGKEGICALTKVYDAVGKGYVTACLRCFGQCSHKSCSSSSFSFSLLLPSLCGCGWL